MGANGSRGNTPVSSIDEGQDIKTPPPHQQKRSPSLEVEVEYGEKEFFPFVNQLKALLANKYGGTVSLKMKGIRGLEEGSPSP